MAMQEMKITVDVRWPRLAALLCVCGLGRLAAWLCVRVVR